MLNPPIKNFGTKGIRKAGKEITKWHKQFSDEEFRMNLFNFYLFVSVAGTGDGIFRYMYGRFLHEGSQITGNKELSRLGDHIKTCGDLWVETAAPFKDALTIENPESLLLGIKEQFNLIADKEDEAFKLLSEIEREANS